MFCMDWAVMLLGEDKELSPNFFHDLFFLSFIRLGCQSSKNWSLEFPQ